MTRSLQLNLLCYELTPEELETPELKILPSTPPNPHAIAWQEAQVTYCLKMINRFVGGGRCSAEVRRRETTRLYRMRQEAIDKLKELGVS